MSIYQLDPTQSKITFSVKHMMISKVHGSFSRFSGNFSFDKSHLEATQADSKIEVASIDTRDRQRDDHLKGADFFDVGRYPHIIFKSKSMVRFGKEELKVTGDLTIKGVTKEVVLLGKGPSDEWQDLSGKIKIGISASTKIKRKDFGLTWNPALEAGGVLVGDEISIILDLQFIKVS